jgi:hypothetical protein
MTGKQVGSIGCSITNSPASALPSAEPPVAGDVLQPQSGLVVPLHGLDLYPCSEATSKRGPVIAQGQKTILESP